MIALILPPGLVLEAVTHLLKSTGHPAAAVPWELAERRSAPLLSELGRLKPAIAVVDADVAAGMGLVAFAEALRNAVPGMRVVLLAGAVEPALAAATLAAGIDTVVLKSCSLEEVVGAVDRVREGAPATHPRGWAQTRPAGRPKTVLKGRSQPPARPFGGCLRAHSVPLRTRTMSGPSTCLRST